MHGTRTFMSMQSINLLIIGSNPAEINHFKDKMKAQFLMSEIGLLSFY